MLSGVIVQGKMHVVRGVTGARVSARRRATARPVVLLVSDVIALLNAGCRCSAAALLTVPWCASLKPCFTALAHPFGEVCRQLVSNLVNVREQNALAVMARISSKLSLDLDGALVRRSSSRFCLGVEHGDYNGTELIGVGTNRFIWLAFKPNGTDRVRIASANFEEEGLIEFSLSDAAAAGKQSYPEAQSPEMRDTWARFPWGVDYVLRQRGFGAHVKTGFDAVVYGNIPGGGMSRSASLTLNLLLTFMDVNPGLGDAIRAGKTIVEESATTTPAPSEQTSGRTWQDEAAYNARAGAKSFEIVLLAQAVENDYIGSPCGLLDQIMIYYARAEHVSTTSN